MPRFITVNRCQRVYSTISHQILIISPLDPAVTVYVLDHIPISNIIYLSVIPVYPIVFPIAMLVYVKMSHQEKTMVYEAYIGLHRQYPQVSPTFSIPSGKLTQLWKIAIFNGKTHYKWPFSIATLNYQRVSPYPFLPFRSRYPMDSPRDPKRHNLRDLESHYLQTWAL